MGHFRFWRRFKVLPGVSLNISKSGLSVSLGMRGAHLTVGPKGKRTTFGIPGTGLFHTSHKSWGKKKKSVSIRFRRDESTKVLIQAMRKIDGDVSRIEITRENFHPSFKKKFKNFDYDAFQQKLSKAKDNSINETEVVIYAIKSLKKLSYASRRDALAYIYAIMTADNLVQKEEKEFIDMLCIELDVPLKSVVEKYDSDIK